MQRDPRAFLWDVREAAQAIQSFTAGLDVKDYVSNELVQAAVERKFEVIGEALNQLAKLDAAMAARIPDVPQIVAFRNQLIHGYATVNPDTVWNIAQNTLPGLLSAVQALLDELGS
ncbi:HepT-like ribonuclease domain-containing protein [Hydrogenophaga electricum]|uniref:Antitoxin n=1 Tax=Hydrogenophaga electricum TaxID=1230953 RepID=A0ABQ6BZM9_9BURK|nr:HepT-like ribonuclease domain-containing protein [Hydrogenophaga electricum]GLS13177.1 antitoxin [Hydrogenophaga electricum]